MIKGKSPRKSSHSSYRINALALPSPVVYWGSLFSSGQCKENKTRVCYIILLESHNLLTKLTQSGISFNCFSFQESARQIMILIHSWYMKRERLQGHHYIKKNGAMNLSQNRRFQLTTADLLWLQDSSSGQY